MINWLKSNCVIIISVLLGVFVLVFYNIPFLHQQYGYDQSVYLYEGKVLSLGAIPYREIFDQRMLGLGYIFAALYKLGFNSPLYFRVLEIVWMSLTIAVLAVVMKMIVKHKYAVATGVLFFSLILGNHGFYGYDEGYVEIFMLLPVVLSLLFMLLYERSKRSYWLIFTGLSIFASFMLRISGVTLFLPVIFYIYLLEKPSNDSLKKLFKSVAIKSVILIAAFLVPLLAYFIYLAANGAFGDFLDGLVKFNAFYGSTIPELKIADATLYTKILYGINNLFSHMAAFPVTYFVVIVGIVTLLRRAKLIDWIVLLYLLVGIMSVAIGLKPWPHYFIQLYPFIAILAAYIAYAIIDEVAPTVKKYRFVHCRY